MCCINKKLYSIFPPNPNAFEWTRQKIVVRLAVFTLPVPSLSHNDHFKWEPDILRSPRPMASLGAQSFCGYHGLQLYSDFVAPAGHPSQGLKSPLLTCKLMTEELGRRRNSRVRGENSSLELSQNSKSH